MVKKVDLSILIPARNEMFLAKTIENILQNIRGNTEIIVVLDGQWAEPSIIDDPRVTIIYHNESVGQRKATNEACRLSRAKYVMKIDAHCAVDEGFDVKMMEHMEDDITMLPVMYNLHAFDWVCKDCGKRKYQGPTPEKCEVCGGEMYRDMLWERRRGVKSECYHFDQTLHFQYHSERKHHPDNKDKKLIETMSAQGSCFMLTREKYWELNICDEEFGSWGQQGTEVACKTWLSGGRLLTNRHTWYAHMFRTQGGDFGFPYNISGKQVEHARKYSRSLFMENTWPLQKYPLSWLLDKFSPVPGWSKENIDKIRKFDYRIKDKNKELTKGILYYTDNQLKVRIAKKCQNQLLKCGLPITSVSLKPMDFGNNIPLKLKRGYLTMAKQILIGLEMMTEDIVFFCEHDVLYHPSHFDFMPPSDSLYYYNTNVWKFRLGDGHALHYDCQQLSGLCAYRKVLLQHFRERVRRIESEGFSRKMGFEPGTHNRPERIDDIKAENWQSKLPNVDIRHDQNLTNSRWKKEDFRNQKYTQGWLEAEEIPGWGKVKI